MRTIVSLPLEEVQTGSVLGNELRDQQGACLLAAGTRLTSAMLKMLSRHNLSVLPVISEFDLSEDEVQQRHRDIDARVAYRFRRNNDDSCMMSFKQVLVEHFVKKSARSITPAPDNYPENYRDLNHETGCPGSDPKLLTLSDLENEIRQLPALSETVAEIVQLIDQGETDLSLLMKSFQKDQALASRVLKLANSAFYGFSRKISSLKHAGIILGLNTLRNIVIQADLLNRYPPGGIGNYDRMAFWAHATGTGVAARVLSRYSGIEPEIAFTAGLLHDMGKLVLDAHFPGIFMRILHRRDREDCLLRQAEELELGFDHTAVGARAAKHWKLPSEVQVAILDHHNPNRHGASRLALLVHVADIVCRGLEIGDGGDTLIPSFETAALDRLGLSWASLRESLIEIEIANSSTNLVHQD